MSQAWLPTPDRSPERTIVIGDVHGCLTELRALLRKVCFQPGADDLVLLGDLVDRGPDSFGVVRFARGIGARVITGNHDEKHVRYRRHALRAASDPTYKNPMRPMRGERADLNAQLSAEDLDFLSMHTFLRLPCQFVAVHGGFTPGTAPEKMRLADACRIRWIDATGKMVGLQRGTGGELSLDQPAGTRWWMEAFDGDFNVVYGHAVHSLETPRVDRTVAGYDCWGIDTGCCFGGRLTALILTPLSPTPVTIEQVQCPIAYEPFHQRNSEG